MLEAADEILRACVELGGTLTGEHGIGVEKQHLVDLVWSQHDLDLMADVKRALDPTGLANPRKMIPTPARCGEMRKPELVASKAGW